MGFYLNLSDSKLFRSSGLFWVFWLMSTKLSTIWSQFFLLSTVPSVSFPSLLELFQAYKKTHLYHRHFCSIAFPALWYDPKIWLSFRFLLFSLCGLLKQQSLLNDKTLFHVISWSGLLSGIGWSNCISKS